MKKVLSAISLAVTMCMLPAATALAWSYQLSGSGACQPDGSYKITWRVDNSTENEALQVTASSNPAVVPVATSVPAHQTGEFTQSVSGTTLASYDLTLHANWPSDSSDHMQSATVALTTKCAQPTTPSTPTKPDTPTERGGGGGGSTVSVATDTTPTPQISAVPTGAVNAGVGSEQLPVLAGSALTLFVGAIGLAFRRLNSDLTQ